MISLDELNDMEKPQLVAEVIKIRDGHAELVEKHLRALDFIEAVKSIKFSRHSCGSCGLTDSEASEITGENSADKQWQKRIGELAEKL